MNSQQWFLLATIQEDILQDLCDNAGKHTFFRTFVMAQGTAGATSLFSLSPSD